MWSQNMKSDILIIVFRIQSRKEKGQEGRRRHLFFKRAFNKNVHLKMKLKKLQKLEVLKLKRSNCVSLIANF